MTVHFNSERFEEEILEFERQDARGPSPQGAVLFSGSSTIRLWGKRLDADFPGVATIKRGFGGSTFEDLHFLYDRIVAPHHPGKVVLYSGANDLNGGQTASEVVGYFRAVWNRLAADYPHARVGVVAIRPSPAHWHVRDGIARANAAMRDIVAERPGCAWLDANPPMVSGPKGELDEGLFVEDRLHLNDKGYDILVNVVRPFVLS